MNVFHLVMMVSARSLLRTVNKHVVVTNNQELQ